MLPTGLLRALLVCLLAILVASLLVVCSRPSPDPASARPGKKTIPSREDGVPPGEPPHEVVQALEFSRYDDIRERGGLPVVVTATGQQLILHPKLYSVRVRSCTPEPQAPPGHWECSLTIRLSLKPDGSDPSEQGERISVTWKDGRWVTP